MPARPTSPHRTTGCRTPVRAALSRPGPRWSAKLGRLMAYGILAAGAAAIVAGISILAYTILWALSGIVGLL